MRKLKTSDIFTFGRCMKQLGVKEKVKNIAQEANNAKEAFDKGFDLLWDIFDAATEQAGENALYDFLAGPFEITPDEVRDLPFDTLVANLKQMAADNNLIAFFKSAAKLTK